MESDLAGANEEIRALKALKNTEELDKLRAELAGSEQSKTFVDSKVKDLESKLLAVTLRAEKADIKASTARNEMIDVTKKYAKDGRVSAAAPMHAGLDGRPRLTDQIY